MSMRERVEEYLAMRRSLGFKLAGEGRMLLEFADRLEGTGQTTVTVTAAVAWASEPTEASANHRHRRLGVVRGFARHLASLSRFPCKPRVTNTVNLSQGESSWEEDDQRVQRRFPAVGSSS